MIAAGAPDRLRHGEPHPTETATTASDVTRNDALNHARYQHH